MAKYRNLTTEELKTFEKEFVEYLIVNGIVAEDWERIKVEETDKAEKIIDLFSDVIFEGVMRKVAFMEIRTKGYVQAIQCLQDKMIMVVLTANDESIDLSNFNGNVTYTAEQVSLHQGEKKYDKQREIELFDLTEKGYQISEGSLFKSLILATVTE